MENPRQCTAKTGQPGSESGHLNRRSSDFQFSGLLTTSPINQIFWDNANHLYAFGYNGNKLYVYTVTSKGATPPPGSPHAIVAPQGIIVLPKS